MVRPSAVRFCSQHHPAAPHAATAQPVGFLQVAALLNERYKVGDELKRSIRDDILRLIEAKTYR